MNKETKTKFVKFDAVEFYPSIITDDLLDKAIQFAMQTTELSPRDFEIIKHCALLFHNCDVWEKTAILTTLCDHTTAPKHSS